MKRHRLFFVWASLVALGLVGFANVPGDRNAVADSQAAQLVGGACVRNFESVNCDTGCVGTCLGTGNGNGNEYGCSKEDYCGGMSGCAKLCQPCTSG